MGTSTSYPGPSGRNPLLPPWADDPPFDPQAPQDPESPGADGDDGEAPAPAGRVVPQGTWAAPKGIASRLGRGIGGGAALLGSLRALGRAYVRASGGSQTAAASARAGQRAAAELGGLLASGARDGFAQTMERLGLQEYVGQDAETVLSAFVDLLAPDGALREEAAARAAMIDTLEELFERYEVDEGGVAALDRLDADALRGVIELYVAKYVDARIQQELANRIERGTLPEEEANRLMDEMGEFVREVVKLDLAATDPVALDWTGTQGRELIESLYGEAYQLLGEEGAA